MSVAEKISSNWNFARDFPRISSGQIQRPHFLETIAGLLDTATIVFLEGEEGDGATTTLAQFCQRYPDQTFSLFIKPASRFAYSLDYLRLALTEQFHWYVNGTAFEKATVDQAEYMNLVYKVRKKKKNALLYIVIDGLHQIPSDDAHKVEEIFREVLPLGMDNFRFVIVGAQEEFQKFTLKTASKPYQQLKFRLEEAELFIDRQDLAKEQISEIYKICKGVPGRIASVKRLLNSGVSLGEILEGEPAKYLEFIKLEFIAVHTLSTKSKLALAVLTFAKRSLSRSELESITSCNSAEIHELEQNCTFLTSGLEAEAAYTFVSESHRRFAEKALGELQKNALSLQVDFLLKNPTSENALRFLPTYYQQLNQQQAIVDLITTDHYTMLLQSTQSIHALRNRADLAIRSANQLKAATEVFKFSLQQSIFGAVGAQEILSSEVDALVALNQTERALELANDAMLKEDRLRLLATYCKGVKGRGYAIDSTIVNIIRQIAGEIDFSADPDTAVEVAADILSFEPDLAIEIVQKANKRNATSYDQDTALFRLSITATLTDGADNSGFTKKSGKLISDSSLQKFSASLNAFTEQMPMGEVISTAAQMEIEQKIIFLRSVINVRRRHVDILDVVDYALDVLIKEAHYIPKARDLADFCIPLPIADISSGRVEQLIERFDAQLGLIAKSSISKYLVIFQMRLAKAQLKFNRLSGSERITQTYYDVCAISMPEVKAECFSIMLNMLEGMDSDNALELENGFRSVIKADLSAVTRAILEHTADHFSAVEGVLKSLCRTDLDAAFTLAGILNTEWRRDKAFTLVAANIGKLEHSESRKAYLFRSFSSITNTIDLDNAILVFFQALSRNEGRLAWFETCAAIRGRATSYECICECALVELKIKCESVEPTADDIEKISSLIDKVDSRLVALNFMFTACATVAERDRDASVLLFDRAHNLKSQLTPSSDRAKATLEQCIYLTSRISQPIIKAGIFDDEALIRFSLLVEILPSSLSQLYAYCDLAARSWCAGRADLTKRIMQEKCQPIIDSSRKLDFMLHLQALRVCFPIVRCYSSVLAFDYLSRLPKNLAEEALHEAACLIIRRITPYDPYYSDDLDWFPLERDDLLDLWSLIEKHETDSGFYGTLSSVLDSVCSKVNRTVFTAQQKADLFQKLQRIINSKLPDSNNISHNGYKIASFAQSLRLAESTYAQWQDLIEQAKQIPNCADKAYVVIEIAKCMPGKYESDRKALHTLALATIDLIPSPLDKLSHYASYATTTAKDSTAGAKEVLKRAILLSTELDSSSKVQKHRRTLIDLAERIEVGLADELVELIDDDPARASAKRELATSAELSKVKRTMANAKSIDELELKQASSFAPAAWKNFNALVSNRLEVKSNEVMLQYLLNIKSIPLTKAYGMYMWYVENLCRKYTSLRDLEVHVLPLSEAILLSTEMASTILRLTRKQTSAIAVDPCPYT